MFHSRQKNYRKLALRIRVDCTGSTVLPIDITSCGNLNMPQTKKQKNSQTAIQSLKRLTILQYNISLKLTQNCYCNDFSPALSYQWLLRVNKSRGEHKGDVIKLRRSTSFPGSSLLLRRTLGTRLAEDKRAP